MRRTLNIKLPTSFLISFIVFKIVGVQTHLKNQILKTTCSFMWLLLKSHLKHGQLFWSHGWCAWHKMDAVVNYPKHLLSTVIPIEDTLESSSSLTFTLCPLTLLQSPRQCKWHYSLLADPQTQRTLKSGETFCIFQLFKTGPTCSKCPGASSSRRTPVAFTISPSGESLLLE